MESAPKILSPIRISDSALSSPDSNTTISSPEKHDAGLAEVTKKYKDAGTGVPVTKVPSLSTDALQSPTAYVSPTDGPEQLVFENLLVVIKVSVCVVLKV